MNRSFLEAWLLLLYFDWLMRRRNFESIHSIVREQRVIPYEVKPEGVEVLCRAIDLACVFYCKRVLCLQRSAATAVLLRRHGWIAELVIGVQLLPFQSHAWVEVDGVVANDKPYVVERFQVLERC
jgi:hypothetical protein